MSKNLTVTYRKFGPINNIERGFRLPTTNEHTYLVEGVNVDLSKTKEIERRSGTEIVWAHPTSNLYTNGRDVLGVVNKGLCLIYPNRNWTFLEILSDVDSSWWYETIGARIYCTDSFTIGYIENEVWNDFPIITQKYKRSFPPCKYITWYNSRLYGAIGQTLIFSDPTLFNYIDERNDKSFGQFPSPITMIESVNDGIWVGTGDSLWFLEGLSPMEFKFNQITDYGVIPNTSILRYDEKVNQEIWPNAVWTTTTKGISVLGDGGKYVNFTKLNYKMPSVTRGVAYIRRGRINQYVSIIK